MRRTAPFAAMSALAVLLAAGCVPSSEVPSVVAVPTTPSSSVAPPLAASPQALTTSLSATFPPYPSVGVSQPGASSVPYLISAQSTCLTNGFALLIADAQSGASIVVQIQPIHTGACVLEFGGTDGVTLIVPVTITP